MASVKQTQKAGNYAMPWMIFVSIVLLMAGLGVFLEHYNYLILAASSLTSALLLSRKLLGPWNRRRGGYPLLHDGETLIYRTIGLWALVLFAQQSLPGEKTNQLIYYGALVLVMELIGIMVDEQIKELSQNRKRS